MFPKQTSDLVKYVSEDTGFTEKQVKDVLYQFYQKFLPSRMKALTEDKFQITHLGTLEVHFGNMKGLRNIINHIVKHSDPDDPDLPENIAKAELIAAAYHKAEKKREQIKIKQYEYKSKVAKYQKDMAKQESNNGGDKE
jgi:nucleoid DNA-binding protein